ncbi:GntR family transcriptional regulator [Oleiagrimonas sp. C23AA]|uniref:GntR family transcriptional regulator n=1 Tax=Oleiagrimonas sp. C23AA TaxID=2719047 RepID=UPI00141F4949|nr:GntR family transcriptional regulator [Oleiagrimonas sp. C23AA]NII10650.1 GntR family transcriptional regulator [Oleiagrimonas sp. C23AA]
MDASIFTIQPNAAEPIYRQLLGQLGRMIAGGQLAPGERLPSVREVAGHHAINPMTVSRAYGLAESEGLLERRRGVGMVVATQAAPAAGDQARMALLEPAARELVRQARELELPIESVLKRITSLWEG